MADPVVSLAIATTRLVGTVIVELALAKIDMLDTWPIDR
jgi:hypothetical protein